ncbi:MAG: glycoside hydrolase family 88 protein [Ruminococcus sp.]|nr:glycoside hydrolase family 88 protein [Ruminococcus sp.]
MKKDEIVKSYIEKIILPSVPYRPLWNRENFIFRKKPKWNYIDNCMIRAVIMLYELTGDDRLFAYVKRFIDYYIDSDGSIPTMNISDYNLDNVNGGKNIIYLFNKIKSEKYLNAMNKIFLQLESQPRLECGNFWHKAIYPHQVWLDGVYMALPFMVEYAEISGKNQLYKDVFRQLENIRTIMREEKSGLYFHGYDERREQFWADSVTGLSAEFWLRSMGWLVSGLADICEKISKKEKLYALCADMLCGLLESLSACVNPDGTMCQLPLNPEISGNYTETSGTLLFAYSAVKSYRLGIVGEEILQSGAKAFNSVTEKYISFNEIPVLKNICLCAGLGGNEKRDGSAEYYLSERVTENDAKGIAPYLMAYAEIKKQSL